MIEVGLQVSAKLQVDSEDARMAKCRFSIDSVSKLHRRQLDQAKLTGPGAALYAKQGNAFNLPC